MYTRVEVKRYGLSLLEGAFTSLTRLSAPALDLPFILLPFRPTSDPSAARTFVRNYFFPPGDREMLKGDELMRELRLTEPMVCDLLHTRKGTSLMISGFGERYEMVLEPAARRCGHLGSI
jgi:Domain of unknown function (DUF1708)